MGTDSSFLTKCRCIIWDRFMPLGLHQITRILLRNATLLAGVVLLVAVSVPAQSTGAKAAPPACGTEIPTGLRVIKLPDAEQHKVTISDFSISASKDTQTYDLSMQIKNGTTAWCITSLAFTYVFGDARGQEWTANEYPSVVNFKEKSNSPPSAKTVKASLSLNQPAPKVGMPPGKDQRRTVFNVYDYIDPHPAGFFDGFHLISAEIKYCMGYTLTGAK
jgi:hypothetical protein